MPRRRLFIRGVHAEAWSVCVVLPVVFSRCARERVIASDSQTGTTRRRECELGPVSEGLRGGHEGE
eukprot:1254675-Lingulodinium_polyedra.AAC.1